MSCPTSQIQEWKDKHPNLFRIIVGDQEYIYRQLNIGECEAVQIALQTDINVAYDLTINKALLYPHPASLENKPAGNVLCVVNSILLSAGVFHEDEFQKILEDTKRDVHAQSNSDFQQWKLVIMRTFAGYTFEVLDKMNPYEFFKLIRLCESVHNQTFITPQKKKPIEKDKIVQPDQITQDVNIGAGSKIHNAPPGEAYGRPPEEINELAANQAADALIKRWREIKENL